MLIPDYTWVNIKYLLVIQPTRLVLYICYFALGIYAYRKKWFTGSGYSPPVIPWVLMSILLGVVFVVYKGLLF